MWDFSPPFIPDTAILNIRDLIPVDFKLLVRLQNIIYDIIMSIDQWEFKQAIHTKSRVENFWIHKSQIYVTSRYRQPLPPMTPYSLVLIHYFL